MLKYRIHCSACNNDTLMIETKDSISDTYSNSRDTLCIKCVDCGRTLATFSCYSLNFSEEERMEEEDDVEKAEITD